MHDFGAFAYLDVQKTGSTFVSGFLSRHCAAHEVAHRKHGAVTEPGADGTFYFISVRDPLSQYRSLYAHGVGGKGRLRARLAEVGRAGDTYDGSRAGFARWLGFVLDPANHGLLAPRYLASEARLYGLQTHRVLQLSFLRPRRVVASFACRADVSAAYAARRLHQAVIRTETLNSDLARLVDGPLASFTADAAAAQAELARPPNKVNASAHSEGTLDLGIDPATAALIAEREWFFYDVLGYARPAAAVSRGQAATRSSPAG